MKNTQEFKLPVLVAAGLHGALLLWIPATNLPGLLRASPPPALPPLPPVEEIIEMTPPEPSEAPMAALPGGGQSVPDLPDTPQPLTVKTVFIMTSVPLPPVAAIDKTATRLPTIPGTGPGEGVGGPATSIIDVSKLDRMPRATVQPAPDYPPGLRHEGVRGSVMIEFVVNAEGRVVRAEALRATHRELIEPTIRAVLKWRFEPGRRAGKAVPFRMAVPVEFALNEA